MNKQILGCFETVSLPQLGIHDVIAKIDTGAYSGALHCTDIKVIRRGPEGQRVLKFTPLGKASLATETTKFHQTYVRSATGHRIKRNLINTKIEINGKVYSVRIGLSDRTDMKKPILVGRRFLRENKMLVDVLVNKQWDDEGEATQ